MNLSIKQVGKLITGHVLKENTMNHQFQSAFSSTENYSSDEFEKRCNMPAKFHKMPDIAVTCKVKVLPNYRSKYKAAEFEDPRPRLLEEPANKIAPMLTIIFQKSLDVGDKLTRWKTTRFNSDNI
jgi:hypothetical protein